MQYLVNAKAESDKFIFFALLMSRFYCIFLWDKDTQQMKKYILCCYRLIGAQCDKIALKMLGNIVSQLEHSVNASCLPQTAIMPVFNF